MDNQPINWRFDEFSKAMMLTAESMGTGKIREMAIQVNRRTLDLPFSEPIKIFQVASSAQQVLREPMCAISDVLNPDRGPQYVFHDSMVEPLLALTKYAEEFKDFFPEADGITMAIMSKLSDQSINLREKVIQVLDLIATIAICKTDNFYEQYKRCDFKTGTMAPAETTEPASAVTPVDA